MIVIKKIKRRSQRRWCFRCRKRQVFDWQMSVPLNPYLEPTERWLCRACKEESSIFPGRQSNHA